MRVGWGYRAANMHLFCTSLLARLAHIHKLPAACALNPRLGIAQTTFNVGLLAVALNCIIQWLLPAFSCIRRLARWARVLQHNELS